jgi:hypothetical protein
MAFQSQYYVHKCKKIKLGTYNLIKIILRNDSQQEAITVAWVDVKNFIQLASYRKIMINLSWWIFWWFFDVHELESVSQSSQVIIELGCSGKIGRAGIHVSLRYEVHEAWQYMQLQYILLEVVEYGYVPLIHCQYFVNVYICIILKT